MNKKSVDNIINVEACPVCGRIVKDEAIGVIFDTQRLNECETKKEIMKYLKNCEIACLDCADNITAGRNDYEDVFGEPFEIKKTSFINRILGLFRRK